MKKLLSLNVGEPRRVDWRGQEMTTAIFKDPVAGRRAVRGYNVEGDRQADPRYHGGELKALYGYPSEHGAFWKETFPDHEFPPGVFGENLTTQGLLEDDLRLGDRLRIGTVELRVTQPRMPCANLALRFRDPEVVKAFTAARRPGFYLGVVQEGDLAAGDAIEHIREDPAAPTVRDVADLRYGHLRDADVARAALALGTLGPEWRDPLEKIAG